MHKLKREKEKTWEIILGHLKDELRELQNLSMAQQNNFVIVSKPSSNEGILRFKSNHPLVAPFIFQKNSEILEEYR